MKTLVFVSARSATAGQSPAIVVAGLCFIAVTYGLIRLAYGLFLPDIQDDIGLGAATAGLISATASLMYCAAAICGFFSGSAHPRALVVAATAAGSLGVWTMVTAHGVGAFAIGAVLSSAAAGLASPALVQLVQSNVATPQVDRAQSAVNAGTGPGLVGAGLLALALLPEWRVAWAAVGVITVVSGLVVLATAHSTHPSTPTDDKNTTAAFTAWILRHRIALVVAVLMGIASGSVWTYGRSALVAAQPTDATGATTTTVAWIFLGIGGTAVIATATRMARLTPTGSWGISCVTMAIGILAIGALPHLTVVAFLACILFGWGFVAATSALISWTSWIDPTRASAGTALLFVTAIFGQAIGAGALGFLIDAMGFGVVFACAAIAALLAATPGLARFSHIRKAAP